MDWKNIGMIALVALAVIILVKNVPAGKGTVIEDKLKFKKG